MKSSSGKPAPLSDWIVLLSVMFLFATLLSRKAGAEKLAYGCGALCLLSYIAIFVLKHRHRKRSGKPSMWNKEVWRELRKNPLAEAPKAQRVATLYALLVAVLGIALSWVITYWTVNHFIHEPPDQRPSLKWCALVMVVLITSLCLVASVGRVLLFFILSQVMNVGDFEEITHLGSRWPILHTLFHEVDEFFLQRKRRKTSP